jgi:hypothetical protein
VIDSSWPTPERSEAKVVRTDGFDGGLDIARLPPGPAVS